jgi:8-oxo-dGTP diphosphatase
MNHRVANYCPACGTALEQKQRFGKLRPTCPDCDHVVFFDPKVAVVILTVQGDKVLLIQRAIDPGLGKWALPAGFVDAGEAPAAAAQREICEETGLNVRIDRLLNVFSASDDGGLADIIIAYAASVIDGTLCAADDAADARWYTAAELPELVFTTTQTLIARWKENNL